MVPSKKLIIGCLEKKRSDSTCIQMRKREHMRSKFLSMGACRPDWTGTWDKHGLPLQREGSARCEFKAREEKKERGRSAGGPVRIRGVNKKVRGWLNQQGSR